MAPEGDETGSGIPQGYAPKAALPYDGLVARDRRNVRYDAIDFAYDACIDIHSIESAKDGWPICGKNWNALHKMYARLIGVVGDFKDGKTFLISLLSRRGLPHDTVLHTPGICITLPPNGLSTPPTIINLPANAVPAPTPAALAPNNDNPNPPPSEDAPVAAPPADAAAPPADVAAAPPAVAAPSPAPAAAVVARGRGAGPRTRTRAPNRREEKRTEPEFIEDCYIDTEGTDQPCAEGSLKDIRATEFLLRTLVIEVSSRVIFVTKKWGFQAQTKVADLVQQLNDQADPNQRITPSQKLIVVHNHPEALDMDSLSRSIQEVEESYKRAAVPSDPLFRSTRPWVKMPTSDKKQFYYDSVYTLHFFLMHNGPGREYNTSVVDELRNQLKTGAPPVERDFIEHIRRRAAHNLRQYINGWQIDECDIVLTSNEEGVPMLVPDYHEKYKENPELLTTNILDDLESNFLLQNIEFTGHSVISDGYSLLQGELQINRATRKLKVFVKVGGISDKLRTNKIIKVRLHENCSALEIEVALMPSEVEQGYAIASSTNKYGHGVYKVSLPEHLHFVLPECNPIEMVVIRDGVIILTLDLARDVNMYNNMADKEEVEEEMLEEEPSLVYSSPSTTTTTTYATTEGTCGDTV